MAISAYTGLQGSGKSYEVVSHVIVKAVDLGRRVVSNIEGLNPQRIRDYVLEQRGDRSGAPLGEVVLVSNEDVNKPNFFPTSVSDNTSVVRAGDLVCIDEAWRFWGKEFQVYRPHAIFFREHRHFIHPETGVSCDLVVITQHMSDLNPMLKNVIKENFLTEKKTKIGFSKVYSLKTFEGNRQSKTAEIRVETKKYNPKIFPLYSSYQGGQGKELTVDSRGNVFSSWGVRAAIVAVPLLMILCGWLLTSFYYRMKGDDKPTGAHNAVVGRSVSSGGVVSLSAPPPVSAWRIVGQAENDFGLFVVLQDNGNRLRLEPAKGFNFVNGRPVSGLVDGQRTTAFSGGAGAGGSLFDKNTLGGKK